MQAAYDPAVFHAPLPADIDDAFDTFGLVSTLMDGHLAEPVAGRLLKFMPAQYFQELLLPVSVCAEPARVFSCLLRSLTPLSCQTSACLPSCNP